MVGNLIRLPPIFIGLPLALIVKLSFLPFFLNLGYSPRLAKKFLKAFPKLLKANSVRPLGGVSFCPVEVANPEGNFLTNTFLFYPR